MSYPLEILHSALLHEKALCTALVPTPANVVNSQLEALIPHDSPLASMTSLGQVHEYVGQTILIPLDKSRQHAVPGSGNANANLVVIGEAPGEEEDNQGLPFVGRAGQLLTKILAAINFTREEIFITNILKSRPPRNRNPLPEEMTGHMPVLYKQLALINPCLILCVGRIAGNALLGNDTALKNLRGSFHDFHGIPCMVTYHPAALLRNPNWKRPTWEDVQRLRERYDQLVIT